MSSSSNTWIVGILVAAVILIMLYISNRNAMPSLHGLTVEEAEVIIKNSGKNIKLGEKIGFEQPSIGKSFLLGRISQQQYIPGDTPEQPGVLNYMLYQIDTSQIDNFLQNSGTLLEGQDETIKQLQDLSTLSQELDDLYKIEGEKEELQKQLAYERHLEDQRQEEERQMEAQRRYEETQREIAQRHAAPHPSELSRGTMQQKKQRKVVPVRGLVNEITMDTPMNDRNRLGMAVPDRASSTKVYAAKESFFW